MPRPPSRPELTLDREEPEGEEHPDNLAHWTAKELSVRAINATLALAQEVGKLTRVVAELEEKLKNDYEDTKTHQLKTLKARDRWFKRIITAVVTAVVIAEVARMLHLPIVGG